MNASVRHFDSCVVHIGLILGNLKHISCQSVGAQPSLLSETHVLCSDYAAIFYLDVHISTVLFFNVVVRISNFADVSILDWMRRLTITNIKWSFHG